MPDPPFSEVLESFTMELVLRRRATIRLPYAHSIIFSVDLQGIKISCLRNRVLQHENFVESSACEISLYRLLTFFEDPVIDADLLGSDRLVRSPFFTPFTFFVHSAGGALPDDECPSLPWVTFLLAPHSRTYDLGS